MNHETLFDRAQRVIPGGVNSPVRAFNSVGGTPIYVAAGKGAKITLCDGRTLTDYCCSWGAMILGHAAPAVTRAVTQATKLGTTFGINTPGEVDFAEALLKHIPFLEKVRLVNSGTEAVMTAVRLARGVTGREKIVKFEGCYHGHSDGLLVAAGSGVLTGGASGTVVATRGIPHSATQDAWILPYNDLEAVRALFTEHGSEIAAVIVEPIAGNMGCVQPLPGFLEGLRQLTQSYGARLIFDEVINAFRFHAGLYASLCGVTPDIVTMGKVIGGGFPLAAVAGSAADMDQLAPTGGIYQAGTLSGNPVAVAAGATVLAALDRKTPYPKMIRFAQEIEHRVNASAKKYGVPFHIARAYDIFTPFASDREIHNLTDAKHCDTARYSAFFHGMLSRGIYIAPSQFEVNFISAAHTHRDIDAFCRSADEVLCELSCVKEGEEA